MEGKLVDKLEDMSLKEQMNTFYTAYSNVSRRHLFCACNGVYRAAC